MRGVAFFRDRPQTGFMTSIFAASKATARASLRVGAGAQALVAVIAVAMLRVGVAPHRSPAQGPPALH
jgi:hypothetical protein